MGFFDQSIVSRIEGKDLNFFILVELWLHLAYSESAPRFFSTTYEDSIGSIFQPWETGYYIREQNAIKIKSYSAYSPNALNELNIP